ncbi:MAG TPA: universal stress protein [Ktedonobacterales bacterium]|nr:universal stress protein [Ktedonobacterales bacterium]
MFQRILVPLDGSMRAESAIPVAARIARATRGTVILMRCIEPLTRYGPYISAPSGPASTFSTAERDRISTYLTQMASYASLDGVRTVTRVAEGLAADSIVTLSQSESADLIVLCAHGTTGYHRWKIGGVAQQVIRHAQAPTLLLNELAADQQASVAIDLLSHAQSALIPLDGSMLAEAAIPPAIELLAALAPRTGKLHLLMAVAPYTAKELGISEDELVQQTQTYVDRLARQLRSTPTEHLRLNISASVVVDTDAADRIISIAEPQSEDSDEPRAPGYDIIVMATHGRTGMLHWAMGSVTERVVQTTRLPMLIVRPVANSLMTGKATQPVSAQVTPATTTASSK